MEGKTIEKQTLDKKVMESIIAIPAVKEGASFGTKGFRSPFGDDGSILFPNLSK